MKPNKIDWQKVSKKDLKKFVKWYRKQPYPSNPYIRIDYILLYWLNNIRKYESRTNTAIKKKNKTHHAEGGV